MRGGTTVTGNSKRGPVTQLMLTAVFELNVLKRSKNSPILRALHDRELFLDPEVEQRHLVLPPSADGLDENLLRGVVVERGLYDAAVWGTALALEHRSDAETPRRLDRPVDLEIPGRVVVRRPVVGVVREIAVSGTERGVLRNGPEPLAEVDAARTPPSRCRSTRPSPTTGRNTAWPGRTRASCRCPRSRRCSS